MQNEIDRYFVRYSWSGIVCTDGTCMDNLYNDYLIEWIISKCDLEFDRQTEFNIVRMIVDCVELYEKESKRE